MTRIEDNENLIKWIHERSKEQLNYNEAIIMNANVICSILADISRSLAIIADSMGGENEEEQKA